MQLVRMKDKRVFLNCWMDGWTDIQEGFSEVPNGPWPLQIYGINLTRLIPQAHFNPITPYCTNPNLTLTSLNTAVQIANLIMYRGHVRTDRWTDGYQDCYYLYF